MGLNTQYAYRPSFVHFHPSFFSAEVVKLLNANRPTVTQWRHCKHSNWPPSSPCCSVYRCRL